MKKELLDLKERVESELHSIQQTARRVLDAWDGADRFPDQQSYYLDSVALNLHSFYSGLERIFRIIARQLDPVFPSGAALASRASGTDGPGDSGNKASRIVRRNIRSAGRFSDIQALDKKPLRLPSGRGTPGAVSAPPIRSPVPHQAGSGKLLSASIRNGRPGLNGLG